MESLVEELAMTGPIHEHRVQGPVEVLGVIDAHGAHRVDGIDDRARADGYARGPQHPREMHDVREQPTALGTGRAGFSHRRAPPRGRR